MDNIILIQARKKQEIKPGSEYEVKSDEKLIIPFGSLHKLTISDESENEEHLKLEAIHYFLRSAYDEYEIEPIFVDACLESVENENNGSKHRKTYNFDFKRASINYPSFIRRHLSEWNPYKTLDVGKINDIDKRFLEFLPETPIGIRQELRQLTNISSENPAEIAFRVHKWTRENFRIENDTAETVSDLLEEKSKDGVFSGDCLEYSRIFSNIMRSYGIPTTMIGGKLGYGFGNLHVWTEVCLPIKSPNSYKTMFLPVDPINNRFGNIEKRWIYFSSLPYAERKSFWGKETEARNFKLVYS